MYQRKIQHERQIHTKGDKVVSQIPGQHDQNENNEQKKLIYISHHQIINQQYHKSYNNIYYNQL